MAPTDPHPIHRLLEVIARLRAPDGCPWDREQTPQSLKPFVLEEAAEVLDAIDRGDPEELKDELGDLLLQIVLQAQIAREAGRFTFEDVVAAITDKMVRRHPHVFGDEQVRDSGEVLDRWEARKKSREGKGTFDGLPKALPALSKATRVQEKAARLGFDWQDVSGPLDKVREESAELEEAIAQGDEAAIRHEVGDLLFSLVNVARKLGVQAEFALGATTDRFVRRFRRMEALADARALPFHDLSLEALDALWDEAKQDEAAEGQV